MAPGLELETHAARVRAAREHHRASEAAMTALRIVVQQASYDVVQAEQALHDFVVGVLALAPDRVDR